VIVVDNDHPQLIVDENRFQQYKNNYTMRKMWVYVPNQREKWSFFRECENNYYFKQSGASRTCNQEPSMAYGQLEHLSISTAYQKNLMSEPEGESIPRFGGLTLVRQFETLYQYNTIPIATLLGWNEWIAGNWCGSDTRSCAPGEKVFVDLYNEEYSRDIEPQLGGHGDFYYRLMKGCIQRYRQGQRCDLSAADPPGPGGASQAKADAACGYPQETNIPGRGWAGDVEGWMDGISVSNGRYYLNGWACVYARNGSIPVHLYLDGPAGRGSGLDGSNVANRSSEPIINSICRTAGGLAHRYSIDITKWVGTHSGRRIFVHGINMNDGSRNFYLRGSGRCAIPQP